MPGHEQLAKVAEVDSDLLNLLTHLELKRTDFTGQVHPRGTIVPASGIATFPVIPGTHIEKVNGLSVLGELGKIDDPTSAQYGDPLTNVSIRVSTDGGTTYKYWTGAVWATAGANDFGEVEASAANVQSLPLEHPRRVKFQLRLEADAELKHSPKVYSLLVFLEYEFDWAEDLKRSIKLLLDTHELSLEAAQSLAQASAEIILNTPFEVVDVLGAFDVDSDPGFLYNLKSGWTKTQTGTDENGDPIWEVKVQLSASVSAGNRVWVRYTGRCPVFIGADADMRVSRIPAYVLRMPTVRELDFRDGSSEVERRGDQDALLRDQPYQYEASCEAVSLAADERDALRMASTVSALLRKEELISKATGQAMPVYDVGEFAEQTAVGIGLYAKSTPFLVAGRQWIGEAEEVPLVEKIVADTLFGRPGLDEERVEIEH